MADIEFVDVINSPVSAIFSDYGMTLKYDDGKRHSRIWLHKNLVLTVRNLCNGYLKRFGAVDAYNREVIDEESGNG